jgi:hypothetical protein
MQSLAAALELREKVSPADISFTADLLGEVDSETLTQLVNQWTLGWGSDAAKVLVMGTEEAYSLGPSLAFWNCCCSILWLCGSNPEVLQRIDPAYRTKGVHLGESGTRRTYLWGTQSPSSSISHSQKVGEQRKARTGYDLRPS